MTPQTGPVLIVEDIPAVRQLVELQLKLRGYPVLTAGDGAQALTLIADVKPAVVITDVLMPRVDGFLLAHKLRSNPKTANIPIIFLTATYVSAEDERFGLNMGALRFLTKPVEVDDLLAAVADAVTGQPVQKPPMSDEDFYQGYRERLDSKLKQKSQQIARGRQQLANIPADQREAYGKLLAETQAEYDEIQRELDALNKILQQAENKR